MGMSARSRITSPKPLACSSTSVIFRACSIWEYSLRESDDLVPIELNDRESDLFFLVSPCLRGEDEPHRTQSNRARSTPALAADCGSNASLVSMSVHISS